MYILKSSASMMPEIPIACRHQSFPGPEVTMSLTLPSHQALLRNSQGFPCPPKLDTDRQPEVGVPTQLSLLSQPHHVKPPSTLI